MLAALGGGALAAAGGAMRFPGVLGQQIDASPPAVTPAVGAAGQFAAPTVADMAAELSYDVAKIFRFVADDIRYEPYSGALRGAIGTLWSRAGNSVDKALLLGGLLDTAMVTYQFAWGPLDDTAARALLDEASIDARAARQEWAAAIDAMLVTTGPEGQTATPAAPSLTAAQDKTLRDDFAGIAEASKGAGALLETRVKAVTDALSQAGIAIPPLPAATLPAAEHERHVWVQMADGPAWVDLDPALPGAKQGQALAKPVSAGALPDDLHHRVRFSVVAEEIMTGQPQRRETTFFEETSANLINVPVCLFIAPRGDLKGIGNAINQAIAGKASLVPTFFTGKGGSYADTAVVFGAEGGFSGVLTGTPASGVAEGEALGLWLNVDITGPDHDPIHLERALFDRVDAAARARGAVDPQAIAPVEIVKSADGSSTVRGLQSMWIYAVEGAHFPAVLAGADPITARIFGAIQLLPQGFPTLRPALMLEHEVSRGFRSYVEIPNLTGFTISQDTSPPSVHADLLSQRLAVRPLKGGGVAAGLPPPLLVAGVTNQIAEQLLFTAPPSSGSGAAGATPATATEVNDSGSLLAAVEAQGIGWRVIARSDQLSGLPPQVGARLKPVLAAGEVVVLPVRPVTVKGVDRYVWWIVDPKTGRAHDQLDDGTGSAGQRARVPRALAGPMEEDITIVEKIPAGAAEGYRRLAVCVAAVCGGVSMSLAMVAAGIGYATATSALGKIGAVVGGGSAGAGGVGAGIGIYFACGG